MPVEIIIIALVFLIMLCMVDPQWYFVMVATGLVVMAVFRPDRSLFVNEPGDPVDQPTVTADLDSAVDIDAVLDNSPAVTNGDDLLMNHMQNVAGQTKEAILARARFTSDNFRRYFQDELDAGEQRHWWEDDSLVAGTVKDGYHHESDQWTE